MNHIRLLLLLTLALNILCCGCKEKVAFDTKALKDYYETTDLQIISWDNDLEIKIDKSNLVKKKQERMGRKWVNAEAVASVGAIIAYTSVDSINRTKFDTLTITVEVDDHLEQYQYRVSDIKAIITKVSTCQAFANNLGHDNVQTIKAYLGNTILDAGPDVVKTLLTQYFPNEPARLDLTGFKIEKDRASIYCDFYFKINNPRSYSFTFLQGEEKISGIQIF